MCLSLSVCLCLFSRCPFFVFHSMSLGWSFWSNVSIGSRSRAAKITRTSTPHLPPSTFQTSPPLLRKTTSRRLSMPSTWPSRLGIYWTSIDGGSDSCFFRHLSFSPKTERWLWCSCPLWRNQSQPSSSSTTFSCLKPVISGKLSLLSRPYLSFATQSFAGSPSPKAQSEGQAKERGLKYVNARTNCAFLKLSVLSAISKYYHTGFMQFLGVYINLFLGPSWSFFLPWGPYMPSTYLFQSPPKIHQETLSTLKCFWIHSCQQIWRQNIWVLSKSSWKICDTTKLKMIM